MAKTDILTKSAVICFVDIIDSSYYGKLTSNEHYYNTIKYFENVCNNIWKCFYQQKITKGIKREIRGDELFIAIVPAIIGNTSEKVIEILISFCCILKFILNNSEYKIDIACGIHFGEIIYDLDKATDDESSFSIYGHNINYAKRLETSSREGLFSRIMMSADAVKITYNIPVEFHEHSMSLKGIDSNQIIYEIKTGYVKIYECNTDSQNRKNLYEEISELFNDHIPYNKMPEILKLPFYNFIIDNDKINDSIKRKIDEQLLGDIWRNINETNPIIFFLRAKTLENEKKYPEAFYYYRRVASALPYFTTIKVKLAKLLSNVIYCVDCNYSLIDIIETKLMAEEFINRFPSKLDEKDKKEITKGIENINKLILKKK